MTTSADTVVPGPAAGAPMSESDRNYERHNSVWYWLTYGLSAGLLAVILGVAVVAVFLPSIAGAVPLTVLTASMEPTLPPGTMLVVKPVAQDQLGSIRVGEVISFQPYANNPTLVTHRVIGVTELHGGGFIFRTQGDSNKHADAPVRGIQVRAKLWYSIPGLGWVNDLVNQRGHRSWIIPVAATLLFAYASYTMVSSTLIYAKERRQKKAAAAADDTDAKDADDAHHARIDAP